MRAIFLTVNIMVRSGGCCGSRCSGCRNHGRESWGRSWSQRRGRLDLDWLDCNTQLGMLSVVILRKLFVMGDNCRVLGRCMPHVHLCGLVVLIPLGDEFLVILA